MINKNKIISNEGSNNDYKYNSGNNNKKDNHIIPTTVLY